MSDFHDTACPVCQEGGKDTAGDNLRVYDSGVQYCVVHGFIGHEKGVKSLTVVKTEKTTDGGPMIEGELMALENRRISRKTCEYYGYEVSKQHQCQIANYFDASGKKVMQQLRNKGKKFPLKGNKEYNKTLYGSWLFTPSENVFITITEGQIDALSIAEVTGCKYPVVSLPNGTKAAREVLLQHKEWLEGFKHIVLAFDNDKPGQEAVEDCLSVFEPGKVRVAKWRRKDASDHLQASEEAEIRKTLFEAAQYLPSPILTGSRLLATLSEYKLKTKPWPWQSVNLVLSPIIIPGIYTIAALPGVGKTVVVGDIIRSVIAAGGKVGVITLEQSVPKLVIKLAATICGLDTKAMANRLPTQKELDLCEPITDNIVTFDHKTYGSSLSTILESLPYMARALDCEYIIFDNLSYAATSIPEDERRGIDQAMVNLKNCCEKYEFTLFNVCHLNDDNPDFTKATIRGSRGVMMYSDYIIHLGRNTESDDENDRNILKFHVKKDRETGMDTGKTVELFYNHESKALEDRVWQ